MNVTKRCRRCGKETPYEELVKHKQCTYGVDALCKTCSREAMRERYANPEKRKRSIESSKAYHRRHAAKIKEYKRQWQIENREHLREYHAQWRARPENAGYREKVRKYGETWRSQNQERQRQNIRNWQLANHERKSANVRNRRARKRNAVGQHTVKDIRCQLNIQRGLCYWCSQPLLGKYHVDHVIPLIRGGSNDAANIVCTCEHCNCAKGDRLPYNEWQPPNPLIPEDTR